MSERKVLNKYYPPDFDPSLIPRNKKPRDRQQVVRLMAPFSMRCNSCGEYIYKGKKFNARKEEAIGEDYYGIKIFRFYIKCTLCSAEITFKTDPKNTDYVAEHGASRNFEPWREEAEASEEGKQARLEEEEYDPMKELENRTLDSKREMDVLDALSDIRTRNARNERVNVEDVLAKLGRDMASELTEAELERLKEEEEDEELVRKVFSKVNAGASGSASASGSGSRAASGTPEEDGEEEATEQKQITVKRKAMDDKEPDLSSLLSESARVALISSKASVAAAAAGPAAKKQKAGGKLGLKLGIKPKGKEKA